MNNLDIKPVKGETYYLKDIVYSEAYIDNKVIQSFINANPIPHFLWNENQKKDITKFLNEAKKDAIKAEDYIGTVIVGDICFGFIIKECNSGRCLLYADCYVLNINTGYGKTPAGIPYDYFSDAGCTWNIDRFKSMTYIDFKIFIEEQLEEHLKTIDGCADSNEKMHDMLLLATRNKAVDWYADVRRK